MAKRSNRRSRRTPAQRWTCVERTSALRFSSPTWRVAPHLTQIVSKRSSAQAGCHGRSVVVSHHVSPARYERWTIGRCLGLLIPLHPSRPQDIGNRQLPCFAWRAQLDRFAPRVNILGQIRIHFSSQLERAGFHERTVAVFAGVLMDRFVARKFILRLAGSPAQSARHFVECDHGHAFEGITLQAGEFFRDFLRLAVGRAFLTTAKPLTGFCAWGHESYLDQVEV